MRYLVADMLDKRFLALGVEHESLSINADKYGWLERTSEQDPDVMRYGFMNHVSTEPYGLTSDEERENFAQRWVEAYPETRAVRREGRIYLRGVTAAGVSWHVDVGVGLCELVQVGTRTVTKIDPEYAKTAPTVQVEEPIFEYKCQGYSELDAPAERSGS
jgi:hypothetical protein